MNSMRTLLFALALAAAAPLGADELTSKMTARLSEEAEAFRRLATEVLGHETLRQHALKPARRFRPRTGTAAIEAPKDEWQERELISEYGFANISNAIHELRQVTSVDGRNVADPKKAQAALARAITIKDDARLKDALKQLEKYGLRGAATDLGQVILLFSRRDLDRYEFTARTRTVLNNTQVQVFAYKQLDGPEVLTLVEADKGDRTRHFRIEGEIWTLAENFAPLRITVVVSEGSGASARREETTVDYAMSPFGALLPTAASHRETLAGKLTAENRFTYSDFKKFGASSDIKFEDDK
jgi:hypothetical protein